MSQVTRAQAQQLVGQPIRALRKDGSIVTGKLVRISGDRLFVEQPKGKDVQTKAILPLVLFDLLAIETVPFGFGGFWGGGIGGGFGGWWW
jgi:hypothetical protein